MVKSTVKTIHRFRLIFTLVIVLSFFKLAGAGPLDISAFLGAQAGRAIGMSVGVPENPFNKLAFQLEQKEDQLNQREQELKAREQSQGTGGRIDPLMFWTFLSGIFILFMLIAVNFYRDAVRRKKQAERAKEDE